jgi:hypothetical protein
MSARNLAKSGGEVSRLQRLDDPSDHERHVTDPRLVLGRGSGVDWSFADPGVSRRHAVVHHLPDHDEIEDLGSKAGTLVNDHPVTGRRQLRVGDVVKLASVQLRYLDDGITSTSAAGTAGTAAGVSYEVDEQRAGVINNVARDQYNQYVQQVIVSREDAFRHIASLNRLARGLFIIGFSLAAGGILAFIGSIVIDGATSQPDLSSAENFQESTKPPEVAGVPLFALAMGVALVGFALAFLGAIIQFAASTRRKEVDRRYPLPPGWGGAST